MTHMKKGNLEIINKNSHLSDRKAFAALCHKVIYQTEKPLLPYVTKLKGTNSLLFSITIVYISSMVRICISMVIINRHFQMGGGYKFYTFAMTIVNMGNKKLICIPAIFLVNSLSKMLTSDFNGERLL